MASAFAMSVNGAVSLCMGERREDDDGFHCVVVVGGIGVDERRITS